MNFRGVGKSEGAHDFGNGETEDMENVLEHMQRKYPNLPVVLGGFSFGTYVQSRLQQQMVLKGNRLKGWFLSVRQRGNGPWRKCRKTPF